MLPRDAKPKFRRGCVLPHERNPLGTEPGPVTVRKATPEELAALEAKLGPVCPPEKARRIRDRHAQQIKIARHPRHV